MNDLRWNPQKKGLFVFHFLCFIVLSELGCSLQPDLKLYQQFLLWRAKLAQITFWGFVAQAKSKWVIAELRVQTVYKRKPHHHVVWLRTSSDFLRCSFQRDPPAYLRTHLDKGICQVDYDALWWYMMAYFSKSVIFYTTVLSRHVGSYAQHLGEQVGIWDEDYRNITNNACAACCCWFWVKI